MVSVLLAMIIQVVCNQSIIASDVVAYSSDRLCCHEHCYLNNQPQPDVASSILAHDGRMALELPAAHTKIPLFERRTW